MAELAPEQAAVVEQVSWLVEHQRAHCSGETALTTFQAPLSDEIIAPRSAAEAADPAELVRAVDGFVAALHNQAYLIAGEFAAEALWSFHVHDYITQAKAAGHAAYFAQRGGDVIALRSVASGLKSMLADPHLEIFDFMQRLTRSSPKLARRMAVKAGYKNADTAFDDLDRRLAELERKEPLAPRHKAWLKSFRKLKVVGDDEFAGHLRRIASANPMYAARKSEAEDIRTTALRDHPAWRAARVLCEMAGLRFAALGQGAFAPMRSLWPEGPNHAAFAFRVETSGGARAALFYSEGGIFKRRLAVLIEPGVSLPLGSLTLTRAEYAAIVPRR